MAKFRAFKPSFVGGEIAGSASARVDLPTYPHSAKLLRNMIPFKSGGSYRRPGTFFEASLAAATDYAPHLIPFIVNRNESYALWIERVIGGNTVMGGKRATSNTGTSTSSAISGTLPYLPAKTATLATVGYYDEWRSIQYAQSVDILTMTHPNYTPYRVSRSAVDTFAVATFDANTATADLRECRPYLPQNTTAITLAISNAAVGAGRTLTASSAFFDAKHVGAWFKVFDGATAYGLCKVTAYTNSTTVTAQVYIAFGDTAAHLTWWESAWSDYRGWPRAVGFWKNRIVYGGTNFNPDSLWFSQAYNYNVLSVKATIDPRSETSNTTPFTFELESTQTNQIQWISPDKTLVVGTSSSEWVLGPDPNNNTVTGFGSVNAAALRQSSYGNSYYPPVREGNELLVCGSDGAELRALIFDLLQNSYHDEPLQLMYDEKPESETVSLSQGNRKYRQFAWDNSRKTVWCCDTAGNLFGMTRDAKIQLTAWHSHQMGGYDSTKTGGRPEVTAIDPIGGLCAGSVFSLCITPNPILGTDDVWVAVKRYINSAYSYHIERMIGARQPYKTAYGVQVSGEGTYFTDASAFNTNQYPLPETYVFPGLNHLIGETPQGTSFGTSGIFKVTGSAVDGSGNTTLQTTYPTNITTESQSYVFGLPFTSYVIPSRPDQGSQIGSAQGAPKRAHEAVIRFWRTMSATVGYYQDTLGGTIKGFAVQFRNASTPMGKTAEVFTGDKRVKVEGDYDRDAYLAIYQDQPLPFAVLGISMEGMTYDG